MGQRHGPCLARYPPGGRQIHLHMCNMHHELIKVIKGLQQEKSLDTVEKVGRAMEGGTWGAEPSHQARWAARGLRKTSGSVSGASGLCAPVRVIITLLHSTQALEADLYALPSGFRSGWQDQRKASLGRVKEEGREGLRSTGSWLTPCSRLVWPG